MARINELIKFLHDKEALGTVPSPWPEAGEDDILLPIDYSLLFRRRQRSGRSRMENDDDDEGYFPNEFPHDELFGEVFDDPWENRDWPIDEEDFGDFDRQIGEGYHPKPLAEGETDHGQRDPSKMDIAAWYQPVHFHGHDWGIYIREDAIIRQRNHIAACLPNHFKRLPHPLKRRLYRACYRASFAIYLLHEQYHHKTESLGVRLHIIENHSSYLPYFSKVYLGLKGTDDHLEEALANAYIFRRIDKSPYADWFGPAVLQATLDYLRISIPLHPPGYRRALDYETQAKFNHGENRLQCQIHEGSATPSQSPGEWDLAPNLIESFFPWKTTLYTVLPASAPRSRLWPHLQPVPSCSTQDLIRLCEMNGWKEVSGGKGSHVKLKKPGASRPIIIPGNRKRLSTGSLQSTLQSLGIRNAHELPDLLAAL